VAHMSKQVFSLGTLTCHDSLSIVYFDCDICVQFRYIDLSESFFQLSAPIANKIYQFSK
jgi:hypothetical protein